MPSRVAWQLAADQKAGGQECPPYRFRTSPFRSSPSQRNSYENAASHRGWLARNGFAHALERLRWDRLQSRFSFCTGVGVAENRQEVRALRLSRPRGSKLPFRRRIPASCPFLEIDASHIRPNMIDLLAANIASSGLF